MQKLRERKMCNSHMILTICKTKYLNDLKFYPIMPYIAENTLFNS